VFSGFETSLVNKEWAPTGIPTIYKMIEALDKSEHKMRFVMTNWGVGNNYESFITYKNDQEIVLKGLKNPIYFIAGENRYPQILGRLRAKFSEVRRVWQVLKQVYLFKPDLVYVDRSNLLSGALISRLLKYPVVLRVMGVYPSMWEILKGASLKNKIDRWAFRSPFKLVICTEDGSGGEKWMQQALSSNVPRSMMLNGIAVNNVESELPEELKKLSQSKLNVMFIGRLEKTKGCVQFVEALIKLYAEHKNNINAIVIGTGIEKDDLKKKIENAGADSMFLFIDRVSHSMIHAVHQYADVYVSLNNLGNLSNANLECFYDGMCVIMPESQPDKGIDVSTDSIIPKDAVIRVPWKNQSDALENKIKLILNERELCSQYGKRIKKVSRSFLRSWGDRVNEELKVLENLN
tara:strand:- start:224452 stop:225669 length:1218 start_codon:yes stop_codon:yes gene_type:complete